MKILLMIFLLPITVCAAMPLCGSASATIENRKGSCICSIEEELTSTLDFDSESTELFTTSDYELIVDEPEPTLDSEDDLIVEVQDLADTLLTEELNEFEE